MATIVTRTSKGSALTITELDANFTNLNTDKLETETNDLTAAVTWANVPDANITQTSVTQHQAALTITESQISDLSHTTSLPFSSITSTPTTIAGYGITDAATQYANSDVDAHLNTSTASSSEVLSWTGSDYDWVAQSGGIALTDISVTQNSAGTAALSYNNTTGVLTYTPPNLSSYLTSETNDLSSSVTWANVPDANITQSSVTQHQAALSITESQISDLSHTSSLPFSSITSTPTTLSGYGITDGYANSDVDTHLNTSTASTNEVLSWNGSDYDWVAQSGGGSGISNVVDDTTPQLGGSLDVNGNAIVSVSDGDIAITPNGTGNTLVTNLKLADSFDTNNQTITASTQFVVSSNKYYFRNTTTNNFLLESDTTGNGVILRAPASMGADLALTLPSADGTNGQVLTTNGSGTLSFTTVSGGGGGDVVDDTTPQLGGTLDLNGNHIAVEAGTLARGVIGVIGTDPTSGIGYSTSHATGPVINRYNNAFNANSRVYLYESVNKLRFDNENTTVSGSNGRLRSGLNWGSWDVNGCNYGDDVSGRGIINMYNSMEMHNDNATYSVNIPRVVGTETQIFNAIGYNLDNSSTSVDSADMNIDKQYAYTGRMVDDTRGNQTGKTHITTETAMYHTHNLSFSGSNNIVWDSGAKGYNVKNDQPNYLEKFGSVEQYSEHAYETTHSSAATYTVDYSNGNAQLVTLGANITSFTMSNFPGTNNITGNNMIGSVTLFLQQDGTGGRTISFTAGAGETFKIANGVTTADTGANNITVAHVMKVGSTYLWTISGNYT